jgi:transcriptional regulator with XRE-family HTH domain
MEVGQLMAKAKKNAGISSDYELAKRLGYTRAAVSRWSNDLSAPDAKAALQLAALADVEPLSAIAICELAREKKPAARAYWQRVLRTGGEGGIRTPDTLRYA